MQRPPATRILLALALAVLLPFEQAHCAWMAAGHAAFAADAHAADRHACCPATTPGGPDPASGLPCRACDQQVSLSASPLLAAATAAALWTASAPADLDAPVSPRLSSLTAATSFLLAPDVGASSRLDDPGAHGLRAPPVSS